MNLGTCEWAGCNSVAKTVYNDRLLCIPHRDRLIQGNDDKKTVEEVLNAVNPPHYKDSYPFEVIDIIRGMLTPEQFEGYCLGNEIKYRMRAGIKSDKITEDIEKALWYKEARNNEN